jgi:hypothetical protein
LAIFVTNLAFTYSHLFTPAHVFSVSLVALVSSSQLCDIFLQVRTDFDPAADDVDARGMSANDFSLLCKAGSGE